MENININFDEKILNGICIVDFWAEWCGPCKIMGPIFERVSLEYDEFNFYKFNVDDDKANICKKYGIMSIPTIIVFKDGVEIKRNVGFINDDKLKSLLEDL